MDLIVPDRFINYKLSQSRSLRSVSLCVTESKRVSNHIPTPQTKQGLYFPAITTVCWSPWWVARQRLGGHGVFCLHSSPLVPTVLWCVNRGKRVPFPRAEPPSAGSASCPQMPLPAGGYYWWHAPAWNNTEATVSDWEGREEPHLEIRQSHSGSEQT